MIQKQALRPFHFNKFSAISTRKQSFNHNCKNYKRGELQSLQQACPQSVFLTSEVLRDQTSSILFSSLQTLPSVLCPVLGPQDLWNCGPWTRNTSIIWGLVIYLDLLNKNLHFNNILRRYVFRLKFKEHCSRSLSLSEWRKDNKC